MNTSSIAARRTCCLRQGGGVGGSSRVSPLIPLPRPLAGAVSAASRPPPLDRRRLSTPPSQSPPPSRAFSPFPLDVTQSLATRPQARSHDRATIRERTIAAVARPQSAGESSSSSSAAAKFLTLPTLLTLSRVAAIPLLVALWFSSPPKLAAVRLASLFALASLTDAVDGYLARKWDQCTPFGAFLDPVADKLMVVTSLLLVVSRPAASCVAGFAPWVVPSATAVVVGREIAMSALREWAGGLGSDKARGAAAVSRAGKLKTAAQMVAVSALLLGSSRPCCAPALGTGMRSLHDLACAVGVPALVVSAVLALASFGQYLSALWPWLSGARTD